MCQSNDPLDHEGADGFSNRYDEVFLCSHVFSIWEVCSLCNFVKHPADDWGSGFLHHVPGYAGVMLKRNDHHYALYSYEITWIHNCLMWLTPFNVHMFSYHSYIPSFLCFHNMPNVCSWWNPSFVVVHTDLPWCFRGSTMRMTWVSAAVWNAAKKVQSNGGEKVWSVKMSVSERITSIQHIKKNRIINIINSIFNICFVQLWSIYIYLYQIILTMVKQYYSTIQHFDIVYVCCTGHGCLLLQTISPSTNARFAINNWHRMNKKVVDVIKRICF